MARTLISAAAVLTVLGACAPRDEGNPVDTYTAAAAESTAAPTLPPATPDAPTPPAAAPNDWIVTPQGIGRITAGMTLDEAKRLYGDDLIVPAKIAECDWVRLSNAPPRLLIMVEQGRISRVDVMSGSPVTTAAGARIGDTEERIKSLYSGQVTVQPHKYTDGHYLVVTPTDPAAKDLRIVFETDGKTVTRYRSGRVPAVEHVEGCS